ncbi:lysozyme inhibitor LprI family protein [Mesorhizobium comanense]|uniref:lysozyme inhibitor LprI family protein n=1 Tax=Mesorhizobium comanense TaxID=2502215 RepID=UPI0010F65F12|nr:lysozyme inhibitor LprI family protein [Mesorhizobium comanense]
MRRYACLLAIVAVTTARPAMAQSDAEMKACIDRSAGVTSAMLDCGKAEIDKFDARLNAAYDTLIRREHGAERARLQREQRAWLKHHLRETRRLAADPNNGSAAFLDSQGFELEDISARTAELERRVRDNL